MTRRQKRELLVFFNSITLVIKGIIGIIKYLCKQYWKAMVWLRNWDHYKHINYTHTQIVKMITHMTGRQFEVFMYELFRNNGYNVQITDATADGGKDLILYDFKKGKCYVECKRWNGSWNVGRPELQKLCGAAVGDRVSNMLFITTGNYSNEALQYAKKLNNLKLWTLKDIMKLVNQTDIKKIPGIVASSKNYKS